MQFEWVLLFFWPVVECSIHTSVHISVLSWLSLTSRDSVARLLKHESSIVSCSRPSRTMPALSNSAASLPVSKLLGIQTLKLWVWMQHGNIVQLERQEVSPPIIWTSADLIPSHGREPRNPGAGPSAPLRFGLWTVVMFRDHEAFLLRLLGTYQDPYPTRWRGAKCHLDEQFGGGHWNKRHSSAAKSCYVQQAPGDQGVGASEETDLASVSQRQEVSGWRDLTAKLQQWREQPKLVTKMEFTKGHACKNFGGIQTRCQQLDVIFNIFSSCHLELFELKCGWIIQLPAVTLLTPRYWSFDPQTGAGFLMSNLMCERSSESFVPKLSVFNRFHANPLDSFGFDMYIIICIYTYIHAYYIYIYYIYYIYIIYIIYILYILYIYIIYILYYIYILYTCMHIHIYVYIYTHIIYIHIYIYVYI